MRLLCRLCMLPLLFLPLLCCAATAIIYQPQLRDSAVAQARWPALFMQVHAQGFDTLVVQWTQYGDAFRDPIKHAWLLQRVREAHAAGLRIVLGLYSDPAFFQRQEASPDALGDYLASLSRRDSQVARRWADELEPNTIAGWYLPIEIDDARWRDEKARQQLQNYLVSERNQLDRIAQRPIYVTSFFAGNMVPSRYAELLADIQRSGIRVWVQDGAGTRHLDKGERELYLQATSHCSASHVQGFVYEIFHQTEVDKAFTATALPPAEANAALAQRAPCGGDSVFFALRYLPEMATVLQR